VPFSSIRSAFWSYQQQGEVEAVPVIFVVSEVPWERALAQLHPGWMEGVKLQKKSELWMRLVLKSPNLGEVAMIPLVGYEYQDF
jgi:hypothetical protein